MRVRHWVTSNAVIGASPDAPPRRLSRKLSRDAPNADTTPIPLTSTLFDIGAYVTIRLMDLKLVKGSAVDIPRSPWLVRIVFLAICVIACVVAPGLFAHAAPADLFDEIYARGRPLEANLKTLTASFTETSTSSLLAKPLVATGTLAVMRPAQVILQYTVPERRSVLIDEDVMRVVWPSRSIDQRTPIGRAQRRIQQYFVDKSPAQLRSHFDIAAEVANDRPGSWLVSMTPRRKQIKEGLARLELWLDHEAVLLSAMRMSFPNGDTKLMEFADVKVNPPIDPAVFRLEAH